MENDITLLNVKDNALYFLDRNDIAVLLFWAEETDKYRYGHVMNHMLFVAISITY